MLSRLRARGPKVGSLLVLRLSIAAVLGVQALLLLVHIAHAPEKVAAHVSIAALLPLASAEVAAAACFLVKRSMLFGGISLILVLIAAAVVHALNGEAPPASFIVYAAGIIAVLAHRDLLVAEPSHATA